MSDELQQKIDEQDAEIKRLKCSLERSERLVWMQQNRYDELARSTKLDVATYRRQKDKQNVITIAMMQKLPYYLACQEYKDFNAEFDKHFGESTT